MKYCYIRDLPKVINNEGVSVTTNELRDIMNDLKKLSDKHNIPIIMNHQLDKADEKSVDSDEDYRGPVLEIRFSGIKIRPNSAPTSGTESGE